MYIGNAMEKRAQELAEMMDYEVTAMLDKIAEGENEEVKRMARAALGVRIMMSAAWGGNSFQLPPVDEV